MKTKLIEFAISMGYEPYFIWDEILHSKDAIYIEHALIVRWISENIEEYSTFPDFSDDLDNLFTDTAIVFDLINENK
jgi:hypothetical protein